MSLSPDVPFTYHTPEDAPDAALPLLERSQRTYGFLPRLHQVLAGAPAAYQAYLDTFALFEHRTAFSPWEQQIVFQTANYENRCHYCVPGHSYLMTAAKMPAEIITALREGTPLPDPKLDALRTFTRRVIERRGHLDLADLRKFFAAGYTPRHALEVLVGLAAKLLSNYANALARTELDPAVASFAWTHPAERTTPAV